MKIRNILSVISICLVPTIINAAQEMDYNDVLQAGGFQSLQLLNVHTLDLSNTPMVVDDNFINNNLVNNQNLRKIINLDLSGNINVTNQSINDILNSQLLGSLRNMPQDSERFNCETSTIRIRANGTGVVSPQPGNNRFDLHSNAQNFSINYFSNATGQIYKQTPNGMKFIEVNLG